MSDDRKSISILAQWLIWSMCHVCQFDGPYRSGLKQEIFLICCSFPCFERERHCFPLLLIADKQYPRYFRARRTEMYTFLAAILANGTNSCQKIEQIPLCCTGCSEKYKSKIFLHLFRCSCFHISCAARAIENNHD